MASGERSRGTYSELELMSAEAWKEHSWLALREVLQAAWEHSAAFRRRMQQAGLTPSDIAELDQWSQIPTFSKKELISLQQEAGLESLLSCPAGELSRIYMSPGPIFDPEGRRDDYWGWAAAFFAAGFRKGDLAQMTFSYHLTPAGLMLEEPLRILGCGVVPAGPGNTAVQIDLLRRLPVTGFVGMASYLKVIKDKAREQGLDPTKDFSLRAAFVAAERLPESLRRELEEELGMLVRQGYGTADVGCMAYECPELGGMHISPRCWIEIVDPKTKEPLPDGEAGEVVVTPFFTEYPLVRLATGDLSRLDTTPCACGRTAPKLAGILGRVDDTAKVKGQFIYPHQVAEVLKGFPQVMRWQVLVENPGGKDAISVRLLLQGEIDEQKFVKSFQNGLKLRPKVILVREEGELPPDAAALVDERTFD